MKTKLTETEKARVLIVDLPQGAHGVSVSIGGDKVFFFTHDETENTHSIYIPPGTWLPAGKLGEVPEEVAAKMVDLWTNRMFYAYKDYSNEIGVVRSATHSLRSLVEANVKLRNPLGDEPPKASCLVGGMELLVRNSFASQISATRLGKWRKEEETVYRNPFLFFELKEKK